MLLCQRIQSSSERYLYKIGNGRTRGCALWQLVFMRANGSEKSSQSIAESQVAKYFINFCRCNRWEKIFSISFKNIGFPHMKLCICELASAVSVAMNDRMGWYMFQNSSVNELLNSF